MHWVDITLLVFSVISVGAIATSEFLARAPVLAANLWRSQLTKNLDLGLCINFLNGPLIMALAWGSVWYKLEFSWLRACLAAGLFLIQVGIWIWIFWPEKDDSSYADDDDREGWEAERRRSDG